MCEIYLCRIHYLMIKCLLHVSILHLFLVNFFIIYCRNIKLLYYEKLAHETISKSLYVYQI